MSSVHAETLLPTSSVQMLDLRRSLGEFVERTHYQFLQFRIMRKDKAMARLVSEAYMEAIEDLIAHDPSLEETLAIMLDKEAMSTIEESRKELAGDHKIPIDQALS